MRLSLRLACSLSLACCLGSAWSMPPVTIVDQGSFAAGGTIIEAKSAYDPYHPKAEAQTLHGDHAIVSYQVPSQARALPLVFCTVPVNHPKHGTQHPTDETASKTFFSPTATRSIWWISRAAAMPAEVP